MGKDKKRKSTEEAGGDEAPKALNISVIAKPMAEDKLYKKVSN